MYWPTLPQPVPLHELGWINTTYLASAASRCDPMLVWGTTVDTDALEAWLAAQRQQTGRLISTAHILVCAVARSLLENPAANCRVFGRRVYRYDGVNVVMPMLQTSTGEVDCLFLRRVDRLSVAEVAQFFWEAARGKAVQAAQEKRQAQEPVTWRRLAARLAQRIRLAWIHAMSPLAFAVANRLRLPTVWPWQQELNGANAFVNYLGFAGAPPLIAHKPATLPMNAYSIAVTMGPSEPRAVVVDNAVQIRRQASLFVRLDHRLVNGHQSAAFVNTLRRYLAEPALLAPIRAAPLSRAA